MTTLKLLAVAAITGIFTGTRGGLFTVAMTRLNVRLRTQLFHSLLQQDTGFFDTTKTGEQHSRCYQYGINMMFRWFQHAKMSRC